MERKLDLETLQLRPGSHIEESQEYCVNEAVAYLAGEPWTDHPACVSPVITAYTIVINDTGASFGEEVRRRLVVYIPRMIGTRTTIVEDVERAQIAARYAAEFARSAAEFAAKSAARSAARYAAEFAADFAASSARCAWSAAESAAEFAASSAASSAARSAAESAAESAWSAARSAASSAAESAVLDLCFRCLDDMIAVGK